MPQHLVGEELVDATNALPFADRMIEEAERLWASASSEWRVISTHNNVLNEGSSVSGVFAPSGVEITRASATVAANADTLFDLLTSPTGYQLIDPYTDPKDHERPPLETFDTATWRQNAGDKPRRLEAANAFAKIPLLVTREFVVLNAIDYNARYFISKSIQHRAVPGTSAYGSDGFVQPPNGNVRALNTFGVKISPLESDPHHQCTVQLLNFADLGGRVPASLFNWANKHFLTNLVGRMRTASAPQSTSPSSSS